MMNTSFTTNRQWFFNVRYQQTTSIRRKCEDIVMPVVIPEFKLLEIERKPGGRNTMVPDEPFLGPTPESFESVDVYFARCDPFLVIDGQVAVATKNKRIECLVPVGGA